MMAQESHFWINKQFLQEAIRIGEQDIQLEVEECSVYPGTNAGDNYATIVLRSSVKASSSRGFRVYKLVIKCVPEIELRRKWIRETGLFDREVSMYEEVFPEFIRLERKQNVSASLLSSIPRCLFSQTTEGREAIVFEDLAQFGFRMADRRKGVDFHHCKMVMEELGKFHSLSYALKSANPVAFEQTVRFKKDKLYCPECKEMVGHYTVTSINSILSLIKQYPARAKFIPKLEVLKHACYDLMSEFCKPKEPIAVLNHGDCWINNLLFRYEEEEGSQVLKEVKFLDFQISRYASPVLDILYFLFLSTSKELRDKHLEDLLRIYHNSFSVSLKILGVDTGAFTFEMLKKEMKDKYMFGILTALTIIPFIVAEPDKVPDLDSFTEEEIYSAETNPFYTDYEQNDILVSRINEVLDDMEENGYLNV